MPEPAPENNVSMYNLQLRDCSWTGWREFTVPVTEEHILSIMITETTTKEQYREFMKQFEFPIYIPEGQ